MFIRTMSPADETARDRMTVMCAALAERGICPTCEHFRTGEVFVGQADRTFYSDDTVTCHLEPYPRGLGHTIIVSKQHYEDVSEMPLELGYHIVRIGSAITKALKVTTGAAKVYWVTMCSGKRNHLHFQLIPRLAADSTGGRVFSSERGVLADYESALPDLRKRVSELLTDKR